MIGPQQNQGMQEQVEAALHQGIAPLSSSLMITWGGANDLLLVSTSNASPNRR